MLSPGAFIQAESAAAGIGNGDAEKGSDVDENNMNLTERMTGHLQKWTNYIHGWQRRYFILEDGTLAYYKSESDTAFGCRGAIAVAKALIHSNDNDDCRFDASANELVWYLRAENPKERAKWIDALEQFKSESGYGSQGDLRRHGSTVSLTSNRSHASATCYKKLHNLTVKIAELETFRDIVSRQVDSLQLHFDQAGGGGKSHRRTNSDVPSLSEQYPLDAQSTSSSSTLHSATSQHDVSAGSRTHKRSVSAVDTTDSAMQTRNTSSYDFRGEALTFKATTAGIIATLNHCVEIMRQSEENWKRKLEKEAERRRKSEEQCKDLQNQVKDLQAQLQRVLGGPDYQEGPNSPINEEEWHDALEAALERQDFEEARLERLLSTSQSDADMSSRSSPASVQLSTKHPLFNEIDRMTREQLHYAKQGVEDGQWQLFAQDGQMKMYKREIEIDGVMNDPLKATHSVTGVTASEYLHYFFEADYKLDWDTTLEAMHVIERAAPDTLVIHQIHKRVWPSAQREALFWTHLRHCSQQKDADAHDQYIVCNYNTDRPDCPPIKKDNVRVGMTVAMVCQTLINKAAQGKPLAALTRNDISCRIIYVAQVNPGGWVPSSAARAIYKREYPKFLKLFTQYVLHKTEHRPLQMT